MLLSVLNWSAKRHRSKFEVTALFFFRQSFDLVNHVLTVKLDGREYLMDTLQNHDAIPDVHVLSGFETSLQRPIERDVNVE